MTTNDCRSSPTKVRYAVLTVVTLMSVLLYLDRFAVGIASEYIREDLRMTQTQMAWFISAFFWSYALCQVPAGWLSDRFGARVMLTVYVIAWSVFTGLMGFAHSVWLMLWLRLFCGLSQAGAYPTSAGLIRHWFPLSFRGTASSIVGLGGRFGAVLAPILTAWLIVFFLPANVAPTISEKDVLDAYGFVSRFDENQSRESKQILERQRDQWIQRFLSTLSESERSELTAAAVAAHSFHQEALDSKRNLPKAVIDFRDWIPAVPPMASTSIPTELPALTRLISDQMTRETFFDDSMIPVKLTDRAKQLLKRRQDGQTLTQHETIWLNRYVIEGLFPTEIRKGQGPGWRPTVILYGMIGILVAVGYWIVTRNSPQQHPWCNTTERDLIQNPKSAVSSESKTAFPFLIILTSASLWGNSLTQFLTNIGWFFVVSSLPRYLSEIHGVSLVMQGVMTAFPSGAGIVALYMGGRITDKFIHRFGLKWGRRFPLVASRFAAAMGYGLCLTLSFTIVPGSDKPWLPWIYLFGLCVAAFFTDFGTPAIWSYAQDVGGRYTSSILGWGNMWGNLGAAVSPLIYNWYLGETPTVDNWNMVFAVCCAAFGLSGLTAMLLDATKPLTAAPRIS